MNISQILKLKVEFHRQKMFKSPSKKEKEYNKSTF